MNLRPTSYLFGKILCFGFRRSQAFIDEPIDAFVDSLSGEVAVLGKGQGSLEPFFLCDGIAVCNEFLDEAKELKKINENVVKKMKTLDKRVNAKQICKTLF